MQPPKNAYPVCINLKDALVSNESRFTASMRHCVEDAYCRHLYLSSSRALSPIQRKRFDAVMNMDRNGVVLEYAIRDLCEMLHSHHEKPVVVLIDEYDTPINRAEGDMKEIVMQFMKAFMTSVLKDNKSLKLGVVTGVLQIAKESMFLGIEQPPREQCAQRRCGGTFRLHRNRGDAHLGRIGEAGNDGHC